MVDVKFCKDGACKISLVEVAENTFKYKCEDDDGKCGKATASGTNTCSCAFVTVETKTDGKTHKKETIYELFDPNPDPKKPSKTPTNELPHAKRDYEEHEVDIYENGKKEPTKYKGLRRKAKGKSKVVIICRCIEVDAKGDAVSYSAPRLKRDSMAA